MQSGIYTATVSRISSICPVNVVLYVSKVRRQNEAALHRSGALLAASPSDIHRREDPYALEFQGHHFKKYSTRRTNLDRENTDTIDGVDLRFAYGPS